MFKVIIVLIYVVITLYLGYRGWKETKVAKDYLVAGKAMGSFIMAMSYGATFISTSAIIGFGGAAALFGFSLLWLTFMNIFVGIILHSSRGLPG
jgi:SSS family solute:Na+ symporter